MTRSTGVIVAAISVAMMLVATACGSTQNVRRATGPCPDHLVIQTDDWPEAEHAGLYQLLEPGALADADAFAFRGPVLERYTQGDIGQHGIRTIEIRSGGEAVGGQPAGTVMWTDPDIYLALVATDEAIALADTAPVVGVMATLDRSPEALIWNPNEVVVENIDDLATVDVPVLLPEDALYADFLIESGILSEESIDDSFDGTSSRWLATGGRVIQPGATTGEEYRYGHDLRPRLDVASRLLFELGYQPYPGMVSVRNDEIETKRECLRVLVPLLQQAWVDYLDDPGLINEELVAVNEAYGSWRTLTSSLVFWAYARFVDQAIGGTGPDEIYGNFDLGRVDQLIEIVRSPVGDPTVEGAGDSAGDPAGNSAEDPTSELTEAVSPPVDYSAADVVTNEFIDETIVRVQN